MGVFRDSGQVKPQGSGVFGLEKPPRGRDEATPLPGDLPRALARSAFGLAPGGRPLPWAMPATWADLRNTR
jgi:hypothetical protein